MKSARAIRAVIFDLDGTLVDSLQDLADALNAVLRDNDIDELTTEDVRGLLGRGMRFLVQSATQCEDEGTLLSHIEAMKNHYSNSSNGQTTLYDGVDELIAALRQQEVTIGILSNKPHDLTIEVVEKLFKHGDFHSIVGARPGYPLKPDPTSLIELIREFGVNGDECMFVGDTEIDMQTAMNAGALPVAVSWGFRDAQSLVESGAAFVINQPMDLIDRINLV